ncbi:hypothetical protein EB001_09410 [bacterium]|nr:hypothetical protein [bacterium]
MGDRANFGFVQPNGDTIVLYGHWAGNGMLANLADAVFRAQKRWGDPSYATRIAISHMIGNEWTSETGWGLYVNERGDNEHRIPIVDFQQQTFSLHEEDSFSNVDNKVRGVKNEPKFTMDLESFMHKYGDVVVGV